MARKLLDEHPDPDDETIKHYLSGSLPLRSRRWLGSRQAGGAEAQERIAG